MAKYLCFSDVLCAIVLFSCGVNSNKLTQYEKAQVILKTIQYTNAKNAIKQYQLLCPKAFKRMFAWYICSCAA